jgi:hypothetical protein
MKLSNALERLLLYKVNRGIARGERAHIKARELQRELAGYQAAQKELSMWAQRYPTHQYLFVISAEIDKIDADLRLTDLTRARKEGLAVTNGLRILKTQLPPEAVKAYQADKTKKWFISRGLTGLGLLLLFPLCHGSGGGSSHSPASSGTSPTVLRALPVETPAATAIVEATPVAEPSVNEPIATPTPSPHHHRIKSRRSQVVNN